ncbi:hypothetical protein [Roseovarius sp.]|uniref:hypothetical protein n=1 Tax=Roseovarius sp. TaxID=1486281 RepID=UPI0025FD0A96|nr:hypothetical protein [Roseovarius sp.]
MPRWMLFVPLMALVAAVAGIGLMLGGRSVGTTETEVIDRFATRYLAEAGVGAARSDCAARPAQSEGLWLVVACDMRGGARYEYFVDGYGRLAHANRLERQS